MSRPDQDSRIADAFSVLRGEEERQCPPFTEVVRRARTRPRRSTVRRRAFVAATAMVGIAIIVWIGLRTGRPLGAVPSIVEWQSPTGFLLETPGREVLAAPAGLGGSVLDLASPSERRSPS